MHVLFIATGETDPLDGDPLVAHLTPLGQDQATQAREAVKDSAVDLLCVGSDTGSAEMAAIATAHLDPKERWDVGDLEPMNRHDLGLAAAVSPVPSHWTPEERRLGSERLWVRVTPVWARFEVYAQANAYDSVAIVADPLVASMLLLAWTGRDWRALEDRNPLEPGTVLSVTLGPPVTVDRLVG
ncbi:MAG: hypothetical protein ACP5G7_09040 [Anaerolineae bacterium]